MKFSELFVIEPEANIGWFDPVLSIDTKLFIDPFLIYSAEEGDFQGSHKEVISFFNDAFQYIAKSGGNRSSMFWRKAETLLLFPEAEEFCLGYTGEGTKGAGSGRGFAAIIASALWEAIQAGIKEITHFEEVGILREGIGADRISDITATILRHRFAAYTASVCESLGVPLEERRYLRGIYDPDLQRWQPTTNLLPLNPYNERPILLAPRKYLRELPTISADEFWDFCYYNENDVLRIEFGLDVSKNVDKPTIINFAVRHPELRAKFIKATEAEESRPYDFANDPKGFTRWYEASASHCHDNPISLDVSSRAEFKAALVGIVTEFENYVENNRGWRLLWNDDGRAKSEEAAQLLFLGIVKHYCKANNIDISREANIGRGPVDFKASLGHQLRALLELKLAKNSKFWNGLERQLPKYLEAEDIDIGYFVVIVYTENDLKRLSDIRKRVRMVRKRLPTISSQ